MDELGRAFREARPEAALVHLDSAACGRASEAVLSAVATHLRLEAEVGGYVAQEAAAPALTAARTALGALLGLPGPNIAFTESASSGLTTLLAALPLRPGASVAVARNEYGPNLAAFTDRGLRIVPVDVDADEHLDVAALAALLAREPIDLVHLCLVSSHRGVLQPGAAVVQAAHGAGVPVLLDAAQALGQVDCRVGADAAYATSRKWLCGPRGVGLIAVSDGLLPTLRPRAPLLSQDRWPVDLPGLGRFDSADANIAGRVGLAVALTERLTLGEDRVRQALTAVGRRTRLALADLPEWEVVEPVEEATAITTLRSRQDADVAAVRSRLLEAGYVTTRAQVQRAPLQMTRDVLRVSPHLDVTEEALAGLAGQLVGASR